MRFGIKLFSIFMGFSVLISVFLVGTLYWMVFRQAENHLKSQVQTTALSLAHTMSSFIDGDKHALLMRPEDEKNPAYREIQLILRKFRDQNRNENIYVEYAYTKIRSSPDTMMYIVDAQEDDGSIAMINPETGDTTYNFTPIGSKSKIRWQNEFQKPVVSDFYTDAWGTWITGCSPIRNSRGQIVGYAYVDINGKKINEELNRMKRRILIVSLSAFIGVIIFSMLLSYTLSRYVNHPLRTLRNGLQKIKDGHFEHKMAIHTRDEFEELSDAFNTMADNMQAMAIQLLSSSKKIADCSNEVLTISKDQAATSSEQSISVTETTATMEELTSTSRYIADNSESVVTIAAEAHEISQKGVDLAAVTKAKMEEIRRKSESDVTEITELGKKMQKITDVMDIINNITEQTKLISFNAALEATGAGEAGKRFSVVAAEIRRLAENVAESTEEIKSTVIEVRSAMDALIKSSRESADKIHEGVEFVNKVSAVLGNILIADQKTTEAAKQISLSTQQQRTASEQVVTTLKEISEGARQLVKASNQAALIASDLNALSEELKKTVAAFKVKSN